MGAGREGAQPAREAASMIGITLTDLAIAGGLVGLLGLASIWQRLSNPWHRLRHRLLWRAKRRRIRHESVVCQ